MTLKTRMTRTVIDCAWRAALVAAATFASFGVPAPARASLATAGFRAVGVAHSAYPLSAMAVAPDGRLFATVQADGQTSGSTPGTADIRVYTAYTAADGSTLDEGTLWATVGGVRATTNEEGLLGLALAPDFATSKLVYVYLTTTDEGVNQHVRVYRENAGGTGDSLGDVLTSIEPPAESVNRNGGPLAFGVDGCLYLGVGDNGGGNRWNAQLLLGTDPIQSSENTSLCNNVCLGSSLYPNRTVANDGELNQAGKVLRLAVEGASSAQGGTAAPLATQPFVFGAGLRNPLAFGVHPLTGQLYVGERGDTQQSEIDVLDSGSNAGWPCLEGAATAASGVASCLSSPVLHTAPEVYAHHPEWRPPLLTQPGNPGPAMVGIATYTGLAYPDDYYGDVFYLWRDGSFRMRIWRVDLDPPCFLPHPNGVVPVPFHDSGSDGDFRVTYDKNGDHKFENVDFRSPVAIVPGPNSLGQQVLYVAAKEGNGNALTDDTIIFRIEYATTFTPYAGPTGRVADSCFSNGVYSGGGTGAASYAYENPFLRSTCLPPGGSCPGQPDGTSCDDGDACDGAEACSAGICRHDVPAPDGTTCNASPCTSAGSCAAGNCVAGPPAPDGTPCPDGDPCNGLETCAAGVCQVSTGPSPLNVRSVKVKRAAGSLQLSGSFHPAVPVAPQTTDDVTVELRDGSGMLFSGAIDHPASDPFWKRRSGILQYLDKRGQVAGLTSLRFRPQKSGTVQIDIKGKRMPLGGLTDALVSPRLIIGDQCFTADLSGHCALDAKKLRCKP